MESFAEGFALGLLLVTFFGILEGLFGHWLIYIFVLGTILAFVIGPSSGTAVLAIEPWPYYAGFLPGAIVGLPLVRKFTAHLNGNSDRAYIPRLFTGDGE